MNINLLSVFDMTARANADKPAIIHNGCAISFGELEAMSKAIATKIIGELHNTRNKPIAVFLPKSIGVVAADLAIGYSGNIFMNLDINSPANRLKGVLENVAPALIVTDASHIEIMRSIVGELRTPTPICNLDNVDFSAPFIDGCAIEQTLAMMIDQDPWCIINTSGSTGIPKSVVLNHRSFFDFMAFTLDAFAFGNDEIIGALSPVVFDIYNHELCMLIFKSATMVLLDSSLAVFPAKLLQALHDSKASYIFWVPSIMVNIANIDLLSRIALPHLKTAWFAGEVFPTKQFNYWKKMLPGCAFANLYGPIEITLDCTYYIIERELDDDEPIPIGIACKNTEILLLNDDDALCNPCEDGEICVRGTSLAMGYYNDPQKTAEAFTQNPLNHSYPELIYRTGDIGMLSERGEYIFKGRKDSLIKHMGYRIELSEIEHVLINKLKIVQYCCAVYNNEAKEITLFYEDDNYLPVRSIRNAILGELPKYMAPAKYHRVDSLPRNINGKIDRLKLSLEVNAHNAVVV